MSVAGQENTKPLYLIVHGYVVRGAVTSEIERIKRDEDCVEYDGPSYRIPSGLPKDRKILVCGGFREICVTSQCNELKRWGYDASICDEATLAFKDMKK
jgi:hypothetical protein